MEHEFATLDGMMEDFIKDMNGDDYDISDSIYNTLDNYIDDLCIKEMDGDNGIFNSDRNDEKLPFNFVLDKVMEKVDNLITNAAEAECHVIYNLDDCDATTNHTDPDYCDCPETDNISAEDFQLYIGKNYNIEDDAEDGYIDYNDTSYDAMYNG